MPADPVNANMMLKAGGKAGDPARSAFVVTPSDSANLPKTCRAIMVTTAGDVEGILIEDDSVVVFPGLVPGTIYSLAFKRITANATTATGIVALC